MTRRIDLAALFWQSLVVLLLVALGTGFVHEALVNLARRSIGTGFGFLGRQASFEIGQSLIAYQPSDSYARAYLVGLLNTVAVSAVAILAATILGTLLGIARLSTNWLLARLALFYVGLIRNTPLLLQLFAWYALLSETAPPPRAAWRLLPGFYVSDRGVALPVPRGEPSPAFVAAALLIGLGAGFWLWRRQGARWMAGAIALAPLLVVLLGCGGFDVPRLAGFNFQGGLTLAPEFAALAAGLTIYTAAYIAEIVRSGILGVAPGQIEAARVLGLSRRLTLRLIVLPQALRIVISPITNQYLNLLKNSSLAIAIGYPDLVAIANTQINQTGQAIEGVGLIMAAYLALSLVIVLLMNLANRRRWA